MPEAPNPGKDTPTAYPNAPASFRLEEIRGRAVVVASGEIDMTTAPGLREALGAASQVSAQVVLDLTSVTFLDSSGIAVVLGALNSQQDHQTPHFAWPVPRQIFAEYSTSPASTG